MQLYSRAMRGWVHPADVFVTLYATDEKAFWLDREFHPTQRFSVMGHAYSPETLNPEGLFEALAERSAWPTHVIGEETSFAFRPGFVGWFEYLADGLDVEALAGSWFEAREALVFDHDNRTIHLIGHCKSEEKFEEWVKGALLRLSLSGGQRIGYAMRNAPKAPAQLTSVAHDDDEYLGLIRKAQAHIAAGDVYQLCLTNKLTFIHTQDPLETFMRLREANPAPYACYIRVGERALVCSSPEQFLELSADGRLSTKPIKGTRKRSADAEEDAAIAAELANNLKERAENLMIVDLMRNDLGRVALPDSVAVTSLFEVEQYATVHQLVSTVVAQKDPEVGVRQVIEAAFPGGSMTGAPKIRAMQIIGDLEQTPRGVYSGVAGILGNDGSAELGMVIRSLVFDGDEVTIGVGGGITIDSNPAAELAETKLKAQALLNVLGLHDPTQVAW